MRKFILLQQQLIAGGDLRDKESEELIVFVTKERLSIEAEEPKVKRVLDSICHNELLRAMGYPKSAEKVIGFWQRLFAQFFDYREYEIRDATADATKSS